MSPVVQMNNGHEVDLKKEIDNFGHMLLAPCRALVEKADTGNMLNIKYTLKISE